MRIVALALHICLAGLVMVSAIGMGIARGQAPVAGHVLLCGSFGTHEVAIDAQGNVLAAPGHCPDCAGLLLAIGPAYAPLGAYEPSFVQAHVISALPRIHDAAPADLRPPARAPPVWNLV